MCKVWALKGQRHPLWMALRLPLRASGQWEEYLPDPAHGEQRAHASGPTGVSAGGGPRGAEGSAAAFGQRRLAPGQRPPGTARSAAAALTALHPRALPGRAREAAANESFPSLEALQERLAERCVYLQEHPEVIRGVAGFGWIPEEW